MILKKDEFLKMYNIDEKFLIDENIDWNELEKIYDDYSMYRNSYETQANLIANILREHKKVHSVKTRVKDENHLIEKIIRKTEARRNKYGKDFNLILYFNKNLVFLLLFCILFYNFASPNSDLELQNWVERLVRPILK